MVRQAARAQSARGAGGSAGRVDPVGHGPHRNRNRIRQRMGRRAQPRAARVRHRELFVRRPIHARLRRARVGDSRRSGRRRARVISRAGTAIRQTLSAHVAADRARSRRPHQGSEGLARRSRERRADDSPRDDARPRVLLLRQRAGRRRPSVRNRRTRGVSAVGRDRFAGGGVPHDAPRLRCAVRALSQLSRFSRAPPRKRSARLPRS